MKYYSRLEPKQKISENTFKLNVIRVFDLNDKEIGNYCFNNLPKNEQMQKQLLDAYINMTIREYELKKVWAGMKAK